jgi:small conductance mechanosensitive channel
MQEIFDAVEMLAVNYGLKLLGSIAIFIIGRWLARLVTDGVKKLLDKAEVDKTLASFLGNVLYYLFMAIVIVAVLGNMGIPTTSVVAILGAATLAIGFALQDSLGNLAAGVLIILLRPYKLDDFVELNDTKGFVTDIEIFHTMLTTLDNKTVFILNGDVMSGNIVNYSQTELIRLDLTYGIGYEDDLLKAKQVLLDIVQADERVVAEPKPTVIVSELADSSVNLSVRPYVRVNDMPAVTAAVTEQAKLRFDAEGISIPFPQRDVHLFKGN